MTEYRTKLDEHVRTHPEYNEKILTAVRSQPQFDAVVQFGPTLGQALIDNPQEAIRIAGLSPKEQYLALGKLAAAGASAASSSTTELTTSDEDDTDPPPAKIPARLGASGGGPAITPRTAKTFSQYEAAKERLKTQRRN